LAISYLEPTSGPEPFFADVGYYTFEPRDSRRLVGERIMVRGVGQSLEKCARPGAGFPSASS
jgi:hypothetical protein